MSKFMIDQIISSPFRAETDLTATYSNDLPDQYSVTFTPIVPNSSCQSRQYGSNVQASVPPFDDHWNTPNQSSESPQNHQQSSTPCTPNVIDPSPSLSLVTSESSKSSIPNLDACPPSGTTLNTTDLLSRNEENRRKLSYKGTRLTQHTFSELVLGETHLQYNSLLRYPRPWKSLKKTGKKLYVRIFNWLNLDDDQKREYLEIVENKYKLKMDSSEEKQKKPRTAFLTNLDTLPPRGTVVITTNLISKLEESRRNLTFKGRCLTKRTLCRLVLRTSQMHYCNQLKHTTPWESLRKKGRQLFIRIFNWLRLDDEKKGEYLETMWIEEELIESSEDEREFPKQTETSMNFSQMKTEALKSNFMISSSFCAETEYPHNNQQVSTSCTPSSSCLALPPTISIVTPVSSKASIPNLDICPPKGNILNTEDLLSRNEESRRKFTYKGIRLNKRMFSASVLGTTQRRYTNLFKYKKPWKSCRKKWKKLFIRIFNWLKLDDEKKREYLEIVENKHKLKMDSRQEVPEDKKLRPASIQNLNTLPPEGTVIITTDLLSRIEESRMNLTYKKRCLSQETLCRLVLGTSRMHYRKQLNRATSWELLRDSGKKLFIRIFNWLKLDDDEKREYLEMMEIKEELKKVMDSEEEMAKQNNNRTASIPNLDAFPPEGTILIPTNLLSQNELNDDKKRENLETMEIKEELKRQMGSSEDRQEIPKQKETHMIFSQMEIETQKNRTASIPNLDACPPEGTTINPANLLSQSTPNVIDPSPTLCLVTPESSKSSIPNLDACPPSGTTLNTTDLLSRNEENRRKLAYKGTRLTQQMFSTLVLRMSKFHYINLLRYTKSWETSTEPIKKLYIRIFNWLELDDDKKREYLEFIETNLSEKILKQKKHRKKFCEMEIESLEAIFEANRYPTSEERVRIAQEMKLDDVTIIDNWFRKRRFKTTKK